MCGHDRVAMVLEKVDEQPNVRNLVIDDKDLGGLGRH